MKFGRLGLSGNEKKGEGNRLSITGKVLRR